MAVQTQTLDDAMSLDRANGLVLVSNTPKGMAHRIGLLRARFLNPHFRSSLLIGSSGRGVFASMDILAGSIVEINPVLILSTQDAHAIQTTLLNHYT